MGVTCWPTFGWPSADAGHFHMLDGDLAKSGLVLSLKHVPRFTTFEEFIMFTQSTSRFTTKRLLSAAALATTGLSFALAPAVDTLADTIELTGVVRDFKITHPDMQNPDKSFGVKKNLVEMQLDSEGKPVLDTSRDYTRGMITGVDSFNQWFRDVPGINVSFPHTIVLDNNSDEPGGVYSFARERPEYFFPANDQGFNDMRQESTGYHNFYFTYEIETEFTYTDPEERDFDLEFTFTGDDDVWVYINGKLAVDLGGVHSQATDSVNLDVEAEQLGLQPGETYQLKLFFAERHVTQSNFRIETTLQLVDIPPTTISPLYD